MKKGSVKTVVPILRTSEPACRRHLQKLLARGEAASAEVEGRVRDILRQVKSKGDRALVAFTQQFDRVQLAAKSLQVSKIEMVAALDSLSRPERIALLTAAKRITAFHQKQRQTSWSYRDSLGVTLGQVITPLERAGVYVPGGKAAYPSSVLMNIIPAKVAGVKEVIAVSPPSPHGYHPGILAAAHIAGADAFFRIGGAQAVAALAYGTQTIPRVDKIVGPGNVYVQLAKRALAGCVGIDGFLGPSEILVLADDSAHADFIAADLIAQAEHDPGSCYLLTTSQALADQVVKELERQTGILGRSNAITLALRDRSAIVVDASMDRLIELANRFAAEHMNLQTRDDDAVLTKLKHAGAVFVGPFSPVAAGDYVAGPSHCLPTNTTARFTSGISVYEFLKRASVERYTEQGLARDAKAIVTLANAEHLDGHAASVTIRAASRG